MANETSTEMTKKDFQFFLTKEAGATDGYSKFVTMQPVNKSDKPGYFIEMENLSKVDWTARIDDLMLTLLLGIIFILLVRKATKVTTLTFRVYSLTNQNYKLF